MKISYLQLNNFRNIERIEIKPQKGLNIFLGNNAQGKTNLLEALFFLATASSFRTGDDKNLIKYDSPGFNLKTSYACQERVFNGNISYDKKKGKVLQLNSKKTGPNNPDRLRVVLFTPDDLFLVKGSPVKRRNFLDFVLKQISSEYINTFINYTNILKKRNLLLKKEQSNSRSFEVVNEVFIDSAVRVILSRLNYINALDETARDIYKQINNTESSLKIRYALSFPLESGKINLDTLRDAFERELYKYRNTEIVRKSTLMGPHLDDLHLYQDEKIARLFASQGQQRNIAVCLKLAELETFNKIKGYSPVLLLDEVLAELDQERKQMLVEYLTAGSFQSFLTSVNLDNINYSSTSIFRIQNGFLI
ncbi:MAG: DNA replication/repair protein RecF [Syntrophomonas sp.]